MVGLIVGIVAGATASWAITHLYYRRGSQDQDRLWLKLSEELRDVILNDKRSALSVVELNELLAEKTIDPNSSAMFPYKACPKCGSQALTNGTDYVVDTDEDCRVPYYNLSCRNCGWKDSEVDREKLKRPL